MWTPGARIVLWLLVLGAPTLAKHAGQKAEGTHDHLTEFFNLLDTVDDSNLGEIENILANADDDVTDPDDSVVDPPAVTDPPLASQTSEGEGGEDVDMDVASTRTPIKNHKRDRQCHIGWKRLFKTMKRHPMSGDKILSMWSKAFRSNSTEDRPTATPGHKQVSPRWNYMAAGRQLMQHFRSRRFKAMHKKINDKLGLQHRHPNKQHRWAHMAPLEKRVRMICQKLQKPASQRFMYMVHHKHALGIGNLLRKAYRMQFVDRMMDCCKEDSSSENCFVKLLHERYDNFCDNEMPLKPWAPAGPRHKSKAVMMSSLCCERAGEERYICFNGTGHPTSQDKSKPVSHPVAKAPFSKIPNDDSNDDDEEEDDMDDDDDEQEDDPNLDLDRPNRGERRKWGKSKRGHCQTAVLSTPVLECCHAARAVSKQIHQGKRALVRCMAAGRKYALHRKELQHECAVTFRECCFLLVHHPAQKHDRVTPDRNDTSAAAAADNQHDVTGGKAETRDDAEVVHPLVDDERNILQKFFQRHNTPKRANRHKERDNRRQHKVKEDTVSH